MGSKTTSTTVLSDEKEKLALENHKLIYSFLNMNNLSDEWYGAAAVGYMNAVHHYDKSLGAFSTLAYLAMRHECLRESSKRKRSASSYAISIEDQVSSDFDDLLIADTIEDMSSKDTFDNVETKMLYDKFASRLTEEEKKIVHLRLKGISVLQIAKKLNTSQPRARRILKDKIRLKFDSSFHPKTR